MVVKVAAAVQGWSATIRPRSTLRLALDYGLRMSKARGYDEIGETSATSDDGDTTYDQDEYGIRLRWDAGRWWDFPAVVNLGFRLKQRYY